jgi:hypothetical protein
VLQRAASATAARSRCVISPLSFWHWAVSREEVRSLLTGAVSNTAFRAVQGAWLQPCRSRQAQHCAFAMNCSVKKIECGTRDPDSAL